MFAFKRFLAARLHALGGGARGGFGMRSLCLLLLSSPAPGRHYPTGRLEVKSSSSPPCPEGHIFGARGRTFLTTQGGPSHYAT